MENCQQCKSTRIADFGAKCSDMSDTTINDVRDDGYVPDDIGIGGGDYVQLSYCLDCGQIQGEFPLPETELERFEA